MAEKEERILIKKQINYHPPYGGWRSDGKEIVFTRSEAIEKISKSLCKRDWQSMTCENCIYEKDEARCSTVREVELYKDAAEAALNALLEE